MKVLVVMLSTAIKLRRGKPILIQQMQMLIYLNFFHSALRIYFGEGDYSTREGRNVSATVSAEGEFRGTVTVQVIPMTLSRFTNEGLSPMPESLNEFNLDPAEAGRHGLVNVTIILQ